jgi:type I restriction enzyme M protein
MDQLLDQGITKGLIALDVDQRNISYKIQNKRLRFNDSEERVRACAYLSLIFDYGYSPEQIDIEVTVEYRVPTIFSDIVVYADKLLKKPLIVVECKRVEASQGELNQAVEQAFGYANSMDADFIRCETGVE